MVTSCELSQGNIRDNFLTEDSLDTGAERVRPCFPWERGTFALSLGSVRHGGLQGDPGEPPPVAPSWVWGKSLLARTALWEPSPLQLPLVPQPREALRVLWALCAHSPGAQRPGSASPQLSRRHWGSRLTALGSQRLIRMCEDRTWVTRWPSKILRECDPNVECEKACKQKKLFRKAEYHGIANTSNLS